MYFASLPGAECCVNMIEYMVYMQGKLQFRLRSWERLFSLQNSGESLPLRVDYTEQDRLDIK